MWAGVFSNFEVVRFGTVHQAVEGDVVIAEQIHHLACRTDHRHPS
jgi:limonene-1,2-epoxide hydrolase